MCLDLQNINPVCKKYYQSTNASEKSQITLEETGIDLLYPILGGIFGLVGMFYFSIYIAELCGQKRSANAISSHPKDGQSDQKSKLKPYQIGVITLLAIFFFTYVGVVVTVGMFLTTFRYAKV